MTLTPFGDSHRDHGECHQSPLCQKLPSPHLVPLRSCPPAQHQGTRPPHSWTWGLENTQVPGSEHPGVWIFGTREACAIPHTAQSHPRSPHSPHSPRSMSQPLQNILPVCSSCLKATWRSWTQMLMKAPSCCSGGSFGHRGAQDLQVPWGCVGQSSSRGGRCTRLWSWGCAGGNWEGWQSTS